MFRETLRLGIEQRELILRGMRDAEEIVAHGSRDKECEVH
jgi:hypothetical protein